MDRYQAPLSAQGVRMPRQLLLGSSFGLVPENMRRNPPWLQPLRRALGMADCKRLSPRIDRGEGTPEVAAHQDACEGILEMVAHVEKHESQRPFGSAASKGSSSTGKLSAIQGLEDWCVWASKAATQTGLDTARAQLMQQAVTPSRDLTGVTLSTKRSWQLRLASQGAQGTQGRLLDTWLVCVG